VIRREGWRVKATLASCRHLAEDEAPVGVLHDSVNQLFRDCSTRPLLLAKSRGRALAFDFDFLVPLNTRPCSGELPVSA
jgi:hypothetical protein